MMMKKPVVLLLACMIFLAACNSGNKQENKQSANKDTSGPTIAASDSHGNPVKAAPAQPEVTNDQQKNIVIDLGAVSKPTKADMLKAAYHTADTAYQSALKSGAKMPKVFSIKVTAGSATDRFNYQSAHLAKAAEITAQIDAFMKSLIAKKYDDLAGHMEPGVDLKSIIDLFKRADANGGGLQHYWFVALQDAVGVTTAGKKPVDVIQGWVLVSESDTTDKYPMLFVANPTTGKLSSVYLNPGK